MTSTEKSWNEWQREHHPSTASSPVVERFRVCRSDLDLHRYMGVWYELARYPTFFEPEHAKNIVAEYSMTQEFEDILVKNSMELDGERIFITGTASFDRRFFSREKGQDQTKLLVDFAQGYPAQYWILCVDENYQTALVGNESKNNLWILSRQKSIPCFQYQKLLYILTHQFGYDVNQLIPTQQT